MDFPEMDFFLDEDLSDVVFVVNGQRIPALKQLLIVKSRVFRAMFSGNFRESKESKESKLPEIEIKETTVDAFQTMVRFIYTEKLVFKDDNDLQNVFDVYHLSERYEVLRLGQRVGKHLVSKLNVKDLIPISRVVSALNNEKLMSKVMTFIEENINEVIEWDINELKELNDWTNDKLLDALTADRLKPNDSFKRFVVENKKVFIKKDVLTERGKIENLKLFGIQMKYRSFDAFKTFVGYLYFDKLILKDEEDFKVIREVCELLFYSEFIQSTFECIGNHLKDRITIENLSSICDIASTFCINRLKKRVNQFIEQNFTEIFAKK